MTFDAIDPPDHDTCRGCGAITVHGHRPTRARGCQRRRPPTPSARIRGRPAAFVGALCPRCAGLRPVVTPYR